MSGLADRRRNLGPTDLAGFEVEERLAATEPELRNEPRPVFISQGVVQNASGSAYLEVGSTRIQCSVYGPEPLRGEFKPQAEVSVRVKIEPFSGIKDGAAMEQNMTDFVKSALTPALLLEQYPKSAINIHISILSGTDSVATHLAAGVNVTTLALVNAGIALHDMVTAAGVAKIGDAICVDTDVPADTTQVVTAFLTAEECRIAGLEVRSTSSVSMADLAAMLKMAEEAARTLRKLFNSYIVEDYARLVGEAA